MMTEPQKEEPTTGSQGALKLTSNILMAFTLIGLLLWGVVDSLFSSKKDYAAKINGHLISYETFEKEVAKAKIRLPERLTEDKVSSFRAGVLQQLVLKKMVEFQMNEARFHISDESMMKLVQTDPEFLQDNKFSQEKFHRFLVNNEISEKEYLDNKKRQIFLNNTLRSLTINDAGSQKLIEDLAQNKAQQRKFIKITFPQKLGKVAAVSTEMAENFYKEHQDMFISPETREIKYVDIATLRENFKIPEKEIEKYYAQAASGINYEKRNVYLLYFPELQQAKKAIFLLKRNNSNFLSVAKTFNKSKEEISFNDITKDDINPALSEPIFKLKTGQISDIIEFDSGYAIAQVNKVTAQKLADSKKINPYLRQRVTMDRICNLVVNMRSQIKEMVMAGETFEQITKNLKLPFQTATSIAEVENKKLNNTIHAAAWKENISEGDMEILPGVDPCSFIFMSVDKVKKSYVRSFSEVQTQAADLLVNNLKKDNLFNLAEDFRSRIGHLKAHEYEVAVNIAKRANATVSNPVILTNAYGNHTSYDPNFISTLFGAYPNEILGPYYNEKEKSYYLVWLLKISYDKKVDIGKAKKEITKELLRQKKADMMEIYYNQLQRKYNIEVNPSL